MIELAGGHRASDPRLGRVPQKDVRNLEYPIAALELPTGLVGRSWPAPIRLDQGQTPRCVGFSAAQELASYPVAVKSTAALADDLYSLAQTLDEWPGEDYDGTSVLAGAKAVVARGYASAYHWATSIDDVLTHLSHAGPIVVGTSWLEGMFDPAPSGLLDVSGDEAGGHAYELRGLLLHPTFVSEPVVRVANTWGASWGVSGDAFMRVSDLERLVFDQDGEAVAYVGERVTPAPAA